jgi:hypothetical protein
MQRQVKPNHGYFEKYANRCVITVDDCVKREDTGFGIQPAWVERRFLEFRQSANGMHIR